MPVTYTEIATVTLGSSASTISLTSIPSTYTDLRAVILAQPSATQDLIFTINSDSSNAYQYIYTYNDNNAGLVVNKYGLTSSILISSLRTNVLTPCVVDFYGYTNTSQNKCGFVSSISSFVTTASISGWRGFWQSTSTTTISRIDFAVAANSMLTGTTVSLYGIKEA
jgi:hypothetical protein